MIKKILSLLSVFSIIASGVILLPSYNLKTKGEGCLSVTDNSDLMPKYVPDESVIMEEDGSPDWVKTLIMAEVRIKTASKGGTLESAVGVLDHYAEMGVNGLWITPVYDPGVSGNGYSNLGPHTIDPAITGTEDYEDGWQRLKKFITSAHERNIRIFLDVISWGTVKGAPLKSEHPDWYTGKDLWGGDAFNWQNADFKEWYITQVVNIALKTGCDGFRYDVEPRYAGYEVHEEIRSRLLNSGRKLAMISEDMSERRNSYNFEQFGVRGWLQKYQKAVPEYAFIDDGINIVDSVKNGINIGVQYLEDKGQGGNFRFYTNMLSCHDNVYTVVNGNRLAMGYSAIFSPFIPLWYIGEEWNNPRDAELNSKGNCLYFGNIDWSAKEKAENREFFEDVKAMIRVRRKYSEIFTYYPSSMRLSNICKINVTESELQPYARYRGNEAIVVLPNNNSDKKDSEYNVTLPLAEMGISGYRNYIVTDAENDALIISGTEESIKGFSCKVKYGTQRVLHIEATNDGIVKTDNECNVINTNDLSVYSSDKSGIITDGDWSQRIGLKNNRYGGVRFTFTNAQPDIRDGCKQAVALDGVLLQFDNLTRSGVGNGKLSVLFGNRYGVWPPQYSDSLKPLALNLDVDTGRIIACPGETVVAESELLKYDGISGKPFSYRLMRKQNGAYALEITVNGTVIGGEIPASVIAACNYLNVNACYPTVTTWGTAQNFGIDFAAVGTGYSGVSAEQVIEAIADIENVSLSKQRQIESTVTLYNKLPYSERNKITNYTVLKDACLELLRLKAEENKDLKLLSFKNALLSSQKDNASVAATLKTWSQFWLTVSEISSGGLKFDFTDAFIDVREGIAEKVGLDGLRLEFDNLQKRTPLSGLLAVMIGNEGSNYGITYGDSANHPLVLVLDTNNGALKLQPDNYSIITDEALKYDNISGQRFSVSFTEKNNGDFLVQLYTGGHISAGIITKEQILLCKKLTDKQNCGVMVTAWAAQNGTEKQSFSVDFIGYGSTYERGDVNGDGYVNILDLVRIKKFVCGDDCGIKPSASDLDMDTRLDSCDISLLKKMLFVNS